MDHSTHLGHSGNASGTWYEGLWKTCDAFGYPDTDNYFAVYVNPASLEGLALYIGQDADGGGIAPALEVSLLAKVNAALAALAKDNPNAVKVAVNNLQALIKQVRGADGQKDHGRGVRSTYLQSQRDYRYPRRIEAVKNQEVRRAVLRGGPFFARRDSHRRKTPSGLIQSTLLQLEGTACSVRMNRPYKKALVSMGSWRKDRCVASMVIEVNRGLCVDEATDKKSSGFTTC